MNRPAKNRGYEVVSIRWNIYIYDKLNDINEANFCKKFKLDLEVCIFQYKRKEICVFFCEICFAFYIHIFFIIKNVGNCTYVCQ